MEWHLARRRVVPRADDRWETDVGYFHGLGLKSGLCLLSLATGLMVANLDHITHASPRQIDCLGTYRSVCSPGDFGRGIIDVCLFRPHDRERYIPHLHRIFAGLGVAI